MVVDTRQEYLGVRYFRFHPRADHTIQVVIHEGEVKKGRTNAFGVYLISRITFLTNYMAMGYVTPCTKAKYDQAFEKTVNLLK